MFMLFYDFSGDSCNFLFLFCAKIFTQLVLFDLILDAAVVGNLEMRFIKFCPFCLLDGSFQTC